MIGVRKRILWIDVIRSVCLILMVLEHIVIYTLKINSSFWGVNRDHPLYNFVELCDSIFTSNWLHNIKYIVVGLFFFISGVSFNLSKNNEIRCLKIMSFAILINVITALVEVYTQFDCLVLFGILHCMATCLFIWILLSKIKNENLKWLICIVFFTTSIILTIMKPTLSSTNILMIFGVPQDDYRSGFDYFPIFPWITVYSFGVVMNIKGNKGKEEKTSRFYKTISFLPSIIGKNSLYVYIFHIPIIIYTLMIIYICL